MTNFKANGTMPKNLSREETIPAGAWRAMKPSPLTIKRKGQFMSYLMAAKKPKSPSALSTLSSGSDTDRLDLPRANEVDLDRDMSAWPGTVYGPPKKWEAEKWPLRNVSGHPLPRYSEKYATRLERNQAKRARRAARKSNAFPCPGLTKLFNSFSTSEVVLDHEDSRQIQCELKALLYRAISIEGKTPELAAIERDLFGLDTEVDSKFGGMEPQMFESLMPSLPQVKVGFNDESMDFLNTFVADIGGVIREAGHTAVKVEHKVDLGLSSLMSSFSNMFSGFTLKGTATVVICLLVLAFELACLHSFIKVGGVKVLLSLLILLLVANNMNKLVVYIKQAIDFASEHMQQTPSRVLVDGIFVEQGLDKSGIATGFVKPIMSVLYFCVFDKDLDEGFFKKFVDASAKMQKFDKGVSFTIEFVSSMVWDFLNAIGELTGIDRLKHSSSNFPQLGVLAESVEEIIGAFRAGADYNYDNAMRLIELEKEINKLSNHIPFAKQYDGDRRAAQALLKVIQPLIAKMSRSNYVGNGPRHVPLGICLHGGTGVGKSLCTTPLINDILIQVLPEDRICSFLRNHNDYVHAVNPNSDFWDGYHGQLVAMLDEAGHAFDSVSNPDAGCEMILRMINMVNFPLNMAHLDDKGNVNFRSKLVVVTTNRKKWDWKSMILPEAYSRRFKMAYLQVPAERWSTPASLASGSTWDRKIDLSRVKVDPITGDYDLSIFEFHPWDALKGQVAGTPVSYEELVEIGVRNYRRNEMDGDSLLAFHSKRKFASFNKISEKFSAETRKAAELIMKPQGNDGDESSISSADEEYTKIGISQEEHAAAYRHAQQLFVDEHYIMEMFKKGLISLADNTNAVWQKFCEHTITPMVSLVSSVTEAITGFIFNHPMLAAVISGVTTFGLMWGMFKPLFEEQSGDVKATKTSAKNSRKVAKAKSFKAMKKVMDQRKPTQPKVVVSDMEAQDFVINENTDAMSTKLYKYAMWDVSVDGAETYGMMVCFGARFFQCPRHYYCYFEELYQTKPEMKLTFSRVSAKGSSFSVLYKDLRENFFDTEINSEIYEKAIADGIDQPIMRDEMYLVFNDDLPMQKSVVSFLPSENDPYLKGLFCGALVRPFTSGLRLHATHVVPRGVVDYGTYHNPRSYAYNIATVKGECGALLMRCDSRTLPALVGLHVSGDGSQGVSVPLYREVIEAAMKVAGATPYEDFKLEDVAPPSLDVIVVENPRVMEEQGLVAPNFADVCEARPMKLPTSTSIRKSPLHNAWGESEYDVAMLYPKDGIDPAENARSNYSGHFEALDRDVLRQATDAYIHTTFLASKKREPKILSYEEAVAGSDEFKGVPRKTSLGYPFCLDSKMRGKREFFGEDGEYTLNSAKAILLSERVQAYIAKMKSGKRCNFCYADFLKDERLKKAKVLAGNSRLVSASPVDYLILCRMYFGDFVAWMVDNRINNGVAVGVNPYGPEWGGIVDHLNSVGWRCIFGDYKKYDGSLSPALMYRCLDVIEAFYSNSTEEERNIRRILFEDVVNSRHIAVKQTVDEDGKPVNKGLIYEWFGSNPSGTFLTTILNSVCNNIILRYVIYTGSISVGHPVTFTQIEKHVRFITFGDDNGMCLDDSFQHITQRLITEEFAKIGMTYTDEEKSGLDLEHRRIQQCSFLKRGFRWDEGLGRVVGNLSLATIVEMPYWTKKSAMPTDVHDTLQLALLELSMHGEQTFDAWSGIMVRESLARMGYSPIYRSYKDCLRHVVSLDAEY